MKKLKSYFTKGEIKTMKEEGCNCGILDGKCFYLANNPNKKYQVARQYVQGPSGPILIVDFYGDTGPSQISVLEHLNDIEFKEKPSRLEKKVKLEKKLKGLMPETYDKPPFDPSIDTRGDSTFP